MASPVDTSVKHFYSAMAGSPGLSGTAGSLIAVLDACLISGFGAKAVDSAVITTYLLRLSNETLSPLLERFIARLRSESERSK